MLKIKDKLGKLVAFLKDDASEPVPLKKCCCEHCDCCCEKSMDCKQNLKNKDKE